MLYVPILKCKQGEKDALLNLNDEVKNQIRPVLEITPDVYQKFNGTQDFWDKQFFYFDVSQEIRNDLSENEFLKLINKCDMEYTIPVIYSYDEENLIAKLMDKSQNGLALNLYLEEILEDEFPEVIQDILKLIEISDTDLIINVKDVDLRNVNKISHLTKTVSNLDIDITLFRNIIFSSNSFPQTLSVEKHNLSLLPRVESKLFNKVKEFFDNNGVKLVYSDYAINHWSFLEYIPGMPISFNIRYSIDDAYVIYKGDAIKKGGLNINKVAEASSLLVNSAYFLGKDYSWGDAEIYKRAVGEIKKPGNTTTWRAIGTNHHITFMVNHLSNQF